MRRCKHRETFGSGHWITALPENIWMRRIGCYECREWLPMGPANDDEPVHIEIQAARMATDVLDEFSHLGWGVPGCAWLACSRHRPTDEIVTDAGWAGYLARQIWAAHDHSHPEPAE